MSWDNKIEKQPHWSLAPIGLVLFIVPLFGLLGSVQGCGYHFCPDNWSADYRATHDIEKEEACLKIQGAQCELESRKPPVVLAPVDKPAAAAPVN